MLVAKFPRVGVHDSNVGGYTSKAWTISRIGSTAVLMWGSVEVRGAIGARVMARPGADENSGLEHGQGSGNRVENQAERPRLP
jgi:hypothetical protein